MTPEEILELLNRSPNTDEYALEKDWLAFVSDTYISNMLHIDVDVCHQRGYVYTINMSMSKKLYWTNDPNQVTIDLNGQVVQFEDVL